VILKGFAMSVYLVRSWEDGAAAPSLVGIYIAADADNLEARVASDCDVGQCEYTRVPHGSLYGPELSQSLYQDQKAPRAAEGLSDDWRELFVGDARPDWHAFRALAWQAPAPLRAASF
jgi:hypothetical protein